jgi:hypothetical protein
MTQVVDFSRLKRLELPEETHGMTNVYIVVILVIALLLFKRYKDIRRKPSDTF